MVVDRLDTAADKREADTALRCNENRSRNSEGNHTWASDWSMLVPGKTAQVLGKNTQVRDLSRKVRDLSTKASELRFAFRFHSMELNTEPGWSTTGLARHFVNHCLATGWKKMAPAPRSAFHYRTARHFAIHFVP